MSAQNEGGDPAPQATVEWNIYQKKRHGDVEVGHEFDCDGVRYRVWKVEPEYIDGVLVLVTWHVQPVPS